MVRYYANMFTASGMLTQTKENVYDQKESLVAICGIAGVSTAVAMMVSSKFFLPSFMSFAYAACIVLVPLAYRILGRVWVRFCNLLISSRCPTSPATASSLSSRKDNGSWGWFIIMQLMLVLTFWSAALVSANGYVSEFYSLLLSFGCFNALCVAVMVTHGVGGKLKHESYRFYQPFEGGMAFCVLQALSWALFSLSLFFLLMHILVVSANLLQFCGTCFLKAQMGQSSILFGASSTGVIAEILMTLSLFVFHGDEIPRKTLSKIRRALSSPSLASLLQDEVRPECRSLSALHRDRNEYGKFSVSLYRSPSSPYMHLSPTEVKSDVKDVQKVQRKRKSDMKKTMMRGLENWNFPVDELVEATEIITDVGRQKLRFLDNWDVDLPLTPGKLPLFSQVTFQAGAVVPIVLAGFHLLLKGTIQRVSAEIFLTNAPFIIIPTSVLLMLMVMYVVPPRRVLRARRSRKSGIDAWDHLYEEEEEIGSSGHVKKFPRQSMALWNFLGEQEDFVDSTPKQISNVSKERRGLDLWGSDNTDSSSSEKHPRKKKTSFSQWDALKDLPENELSTPLLQADNQKKALKNWNAMDSIDDLLEDVSEEKCVEETHYSNFAQKNIKISTKNGMRCFDFLREAPVQDQTPQPAGKIEKSKPRKRKFMELWNWDSAGDVALLASHGPDCQTGKRKGLDLWSLPNFVAGKTEGGKSKTRRMHRERNCGIGIWDHINDHVDYATSNETKMSNGSLQQKRKRNLDLWNQEAVL
eukprot:CAMPEP_0184486980 /NCGR_PEP_ID=MMETSP0113_2-20130426/8855_1 /TAXON_ID=91329 /ORGANISM="Norrisiella sphaerica, Strain BC52" /LENGTH=752 /DNA_ID=CAMNT_0026869081 /DNA_START=153 /DNA_END=2411 /DNA_ORIENTATION=+